MSVIERSAAFLDVESSLSGRRWVARLDRAGEARAEAIRQAHGFDDILARVLAGRGVAIDAAPAFLNPTLRELTPDPLTLRDMDLAAERLAAAVEAGERIAIFGDYDVDGACSAALLSDFFRAAGAPAPLIHIPDRILEGYGPNVDAIRDLHAQGARLLVTVDCGTSSFAPLAEARRLGLDAIVLDHHLAPEILPQAIVVNPNRLDDLSGQGGLCAAGVVFLALIAVNRILRRRTYWRTGRLEPDLLGALDLVALATVADVAPLAGLNRALVVKGLSVMRGRERVGLNALFDTAGMDGPPRPYHLGFVLGPRINAGGRIGDAALGARLLTLTDPVEATRVAGELERLNGERQALEKATRELAEAAAEQELARSGGLSCLVVGEENWPLGVLGLIASKLKERFKYPSFCIGFNGNIGTGSGRGLSGVNLGGAVRKALDAGIITKGGGHAMAAGVTLTRDRLDEFRSFMNAALEAEVAAARRDDALPIDGALSARGATLELMQRIEAAGPFGQANAEPLFVLPSHRIGFARVVGDSHVRVRLEAGDGAALDAICFRGVGSPLGAALLEGRGEALHVAVRLSLNTFRGRDKVEAQIVDIAGPVSA
jgi:single-stranded-DNA-specific exonuclease